jgi:hypothetical protein
MKAVGARARLYEGRAKQLLAPGDPDLLEA